MGDRLGIRGSVLIFWKTYLLLQVSFQGSTFISLKEELMPCSLSLSKRPGYTA